MGQFREEAQDKAQPSDRKPLSSAYPFQRLRHFEARDCIVSILLYRAASATTGFRRMPIRSISTSTI
jgi:hypothetical protein